MTVTPWRSITSAMPMKPVLFTATRRVLGLRRMYCQAGRASLVLMEVSLVAHLRHRRLIDTARPCAPAALTHNTSRIQDISGHSLLRTKRITFPQANAEAAASTPGRRDAVGVLDHTRSWAIGMGVMAMEVFVTRLDRRHLVNRRACA